MIDDFLRRSIGEQVCAFGHKKNLTGRRGSLGRRERGGVLSRGGRGGSLREGGGVFLCERRGVFFVRGGRFL